MRVPQKSIATLLGLSMVCFTFYSAPSYSDQQQKKPLPIEELQQFTRVINHIKSHYVKDASDEDLFKYAIRGMLTGLDPHSAYLDKEAYEDLKVSTTGKFGGLGIEVTMENGFVKVVSPIDDTPAAKAGIKAGDLIIRLDDVPVKGLSLREAVTKMRGDVGEPINLTVVREGSAKPLSIKIVRDLIKVSSTKQRLYEDNYGYIRITHFQTKTATNLKASIQKLQKEAKPKGGLKGLVLDLRNNPGGVLEGAVRTSDIFLDKDKIGHSKLIVYTEGKLKTSRIREVARTSDVLNGKPIVVLVNEGSASASEIVAGALQDHNRAIIMGNDTFGKGSVQTVLPLTNDSGLKLTTAFYYTPKGRSIQAEGIKPDIYVTNLEVKEKEKESELTIREANLKGHLVSDKSSGKKGDDKKQEAITDYQINEAINLLKGLHIYTKTT